MSPIAKHRHKPLTSPNSIRVLDLLPSPNPIARLRCNLREVSLDDSEIASYEALSYVWGSPEGSQAITCDGQHLLVTPNCHDALRRLRYRSRERTLWIDAICIDQEKGDISTQERLRQVARMGDIYEKASRVVIWLGSSITSGQFRLVEALYARKPDTAKKSPWRAYWSLRYCGYNEKDVEVVRRHIMKNPWFTRVWTVQEDAFSQSAVFLFDHSEISSHRFTSTLIKWDFVSTSEFLLFDFRHHMRELIQSIKRGGKHGYEGWLRDVEARMLHSLTALQCSQPHDKIFGLYAALVRGGADLAPPDYNKDIVLLFQEVIVSFIMRYQRLDPLTITLPAPASTGFPSWLPDWTTGSRVAEPADGPTSIPEPSGVFRFIEHAMDESKHAANRARAEILWNSAEKSIQLKAEHLGYISARLAVTPSDQNDSNTSQSYDFGNICQQWFKANEDTLLSYDFQTLRDIFCLHIYADTTELSTWLHTMRYPSMEDAVAAFQAPGPNPPDYLRRFRDDFSATSDWKRQAGTIQRDHVDRTINYAFITLGDGQLGRAHHTCQKGDSVWLLAGGQWPMVLRPQGNSGYRVVAPAYIANIMRGERWPEDESQLKRIVLL